MKNILIIENENKLDLKKYNLNLEELGMIYCLSNIKETSLDKLLDKLLIKIDKFKGIIQSFEKKGLLRLRVEVKNKEYVYWEICFKEEEYIESNLTKLFILSNDQVNNLDKLKTKEEKFFNAFKIYELSKEKYINTSITEIKTKEEYINYLTNVNTITLFNDLNIKINTKELYRIFEVLCIENKDKGMINLLVDYVISTSVYNNFSLSFFNKVLDNWEENNIKNIEEAIVYVKDAKEKIDAKSNSNYEEPVWDKVDEEKIEVEDVEKLLKEFGNK